MKMLEVEVPDEAAELPKIQERIAWFVRVQLKIARWRNERADPEIEDIVDGAFQEAEKLTENGLGSEEARRRFVQQWRTFKA